MPVRNGPSVPKRWSMASASCAPPRQPCPSDSWATSAPRCAPTSKLLDCPNAGAATRVASATAAARDRIRPPYDSCLRWAGAGPSPPGAAAAAAPPPLQHVAGQLGQLLGDGGEGGAFHLPELDGQHLQQVAIRVGGGGAPAVGWGHQTPGDVEPDGPLVGVGAGRGVDGADARRVEDGAGHGRQVAEPPRGELPVFPEDEQGIAACHSAHVARPPISPASGVVPPRPPPRGGAARAEPARTASSAWVDRGGAASRGGPRLRDRRSSR